MRLRRTSVVVPLLLALALTGCGGTDDGDPGAGASRSESGDGTSPDKGKGRGDGDEGGTPGDGVGEDAEDLADIAEELAREGPVIEPRDEPVLGADISWPQCPKGMGIPEKRTLGMPMPLPEAEYVVVGLTNGPGFTPNPCLADQVDWVESRHLMAAAYAVSSYPSADQLAEHGDDGPFEGGSELDRLKNVGYQQAVFNIANMEAAGLQSPIVWIDVEPVPHFEWSSDTTANAAVIVGAARGYVDAGLRIGVYSTPYLYESVVGDLDLGGIPEWRAAGQTSADEALARCSGAEWSIQGGEAVLGQWVEDSRDKNLTCPGISADLGRWFYQY